jgi:hypothetical protein
VTLKEYLTNFRDYLSFPLEWHGQTRSLYSSQRDSHVLLSAQTCFLPIPPLGGEAEFNVSLYNYQSSENSPAVLAIVANECGTSAQIIDNFGNARGMSFSNDFIDCTNNNQARNFILTTMEKNARSLLSA